MSIKTTSLHGSFVRFLAIERNINCNRKIAEVIFWTLLNRISTGFPILFLSTNTSSYFLYTSLLTGFPILSTSTNTPLTKHKNRNVGRGWRYTSKGWGEGVKWSNGFRPVSQCYTASAPMLHLWCNYAAPLVSGRYTSLVPLFQWSANHETLTFSGGFYHWF